MMQMKKCLNTELNGKRLPDIDLTLSDGTVKRLYTFHRDGRFLLAAFGKEPKEFADCLMSGLCN